LTTRHLYVALCYTVYPWNHLGCTTVSRSIVRLDRNLAKAGLLVGSASNEPHLMDRLVAATLDALSSSAKLVILQYIAGIADVTVPKRIYNLQRGWRKAQS